MSQFKNISGSDRLLIYKQRPIVVKSGELVSIDDADDGGLNQPSIWEKDGADAPVPTPEHEPSAVEEAQAELEKAQADLAAATNSQGA